MHHLELKMELLQTFLRTYFMVLLVELGSTSQFAVAAMASHSHKPWVIWAASLLALMTTCAMAVCLGGWLEKMPVSPNLVAGLLMVVMGMVILWKH